MSSSDTNLYAHPNFVAAYDALRGPRSRTIEKFLEGLWGRCIQRDGHLIRPNVPQGEYGSVSIAGRSLLAHRVAYWVATGIKPPSDMQIDHLCKVRSCINPEHLELVTGAENNARSDSATARNARKTHCAHGHEFTVANTRITKKGRDCRVCHRERMTERIGCPTCGAQIQRGHMWRHGRSQHARIRAALDGAGDG